MVDALKDIVGILDRLPQYTIWVLCGLLFYKVIIIGSWFSIIRLIINRSYAYLTRAVPEPPIQKVEISGRFVTTEPAYKEFLSTIDTLLMKRNYLRAPIKGSKANVIFDANHSYLNREDVLWLRHAIIRAADEEDLIIRKAIDEQKSMEEIKAELSK